MTVNDQEKKDSRKLTDEERQKVIFVLNDILSEELPDEPTAYDVLMRRKVEEFTLEVLEKDDPEQVEDLLEICEDCLEKKKNGEESFYSLGLIMLYDMWLNKSPVWPVGYNPEWEDSRINA